MDYSGKIINKNEVVPTQTSASGVWSLQEAAAAVKNNNWPVAGVPNPISKSLRFNSADSAYLNRTPASAGNRTTWTFSTWLKRTTSSSAADQSFFYAYGSDADTGLFHVFFNTSDQLQINLFTVVLRTTTQVFRDFGAWYHVVIALDTNNATASNRLRVYVNGTEITAFATNNAVGSAATYAVNNNVAHNIGRNTRNASNYMDMYLTETYLVDGQALTPSSFGMTDPQTGAWEPIKYTGTYGTNGFYLNFKDATSTTTLGYDYSGNNNNWTTNNFSVTAGAGNDSLTDVPTPWIAYNTGGDAGGVVRGNYCTLNPLNKATSDVSLSNGNLEASSSFTGDYRCFASTFQVTTGKWYWEVQYATGTINAGSNIVGIFNLPTPDTANNRRPADSINNGIGIRQDGQSESDNTTAAYFGSSISVGDVIGVALDADAGTVKFNVNGGSFGSTLTFVSAGGVFTPGGDIRASSGTPKTIHNFGQRPFAYTPPAGFLSLCTTNLPNPTIGTTTTTQAGKYFNTVLYTGNGSSQTVTGFGFNPDMMWGKGRSVAYSNGIVDVVRGDNNLIFTDTTGAEQNPGAQFALATDGATVTYRAANWAFNQSAATYVIWGWKANGAGSSNTDGTITSTVSANTTAGFSVVTFTSPSSGTFTVGHGLGVAPKMVIIKDRGQIGSWSVYHASATTNSQYLLLNSTAAVGSSTNYFGTAIPSSTVFGANAGVSVQTSDTCVAYCFAPIAGYSAFGSYTGNGSSDGPFVYLGFRPRWIMVKSSTEVNNWWLYDTSRDPYNAMNNLLRPDLSNAEATQGWADYLSNGFKVRNTGQNNSGQTYIYAAFAESPFKYALAR